MILDHMQCENQVVLVRPSKVTKRLENGLFWDNKMGQKCVKKVLFPKMILDHLGCLSNRNEPFLSPLHPFWPLHTHKMP